MGLMQRRKGRAFEQRIAKIFRAHFPTATVRRASQADRAHQSDVYITGGPDILSRLWLECQDARNPTPGKKLEQAERDLDMLRDPTRLPVVIWHKLGARDINVTTSLWVLWSVAGEHCPFLSGPEQTLVTLELNAFCAMLEAAHAD